MDVEEEVYRGKLLLPMCNKMKIMRGWQQRYCLLFKASKFGLARLEIWEGPEPVRGPPQRILTLENCIKIAASSPTQITVTTKTAPFIHELDAITPESKVCWLSALQSVAFPDDTSLLTSVEEDNDLYVSSGDMVFHVKIKRSAVAEKCHLNHMNFYILVLTATAMQLKNYPDGKLLFTWPYCFIRKYGFKGGMFTFEAGRKCDSGEGTFFLEYSNHHEIYKSLAAKMQSMKTLTPPSLHKCSGDSQLHAALSMEARSRSPFPPSPATSTTLHDVDSASSVSSQSSLFESLDSVFKQKLSIQPVKPPRKLRDNSATLDYESLDKYDEVEARAGAWRTLGVDDVQHTECVNEGGEDMYQSWGVQKVVPPSVTPQASKILSQGTGKLAANDYDQLDFFGSSNKLNVDSGYKQMSVVGGYAAPCPPPSFNEYDEVEVVKNPTGGFEEIRLANGGRKEAEVGVVAVPHQVFNNEPYAVISKPKRV